MVIIISGLKRRSAVKEEAELMILKAAIAGISLVFFAEEV
jgi:hypothetical protein